MQQGVLLGYFSCDKVQGVKIFSTHSRHVPRQVSHALPVCTDSQTDLIESCLLNFL